MARIPVFQTLLKTPSKTAQPSGSDLDLNLALFALSPRGYWTSGGPFPFPFTQLTPAPHRLNQPGIISDYRRGLEYITSNQHQTRKSLRGLPVWIVGHSLGGAVAVQLLNRLDRSFLNQSPIAGLILENPLPSIKLMLKTIYASRLIPYHYLGPFVRDDWDTTRAFKESGERDSYLNKVPLLIIQSENDELVPPSLTRSLYEAATESRIGRLGSTGFNQPQYLVIPHALHDTAFSKPRYTQEIHKFIRSTIPKPDPYRQLD